MQRLRLRYAKRGRLRFTSHRDVARAFERALRRAGVPMAYSQGYSPHPKISWAGAAPTGVASEAEYVELQLVERVAPEVLREELDTALPAGIDVLTAVEADAQPLADQLEVSRWRIDLPGTGVAELRDAVSAVLAADSVPVERMTKNGRRTIDARAALVSAEVLGSDEVVALGEQRGPINARVDDWPDSGEPYGILVAVVRHTTPVVRPDDVLSALRVVAGLAPSAAVSATRLEQGRLDDGGGIADPLARDSGGDRTPAGEHTAG